MDDDGILYVWKIEERQEVIRFGQSPVISIDWRTLLNERLQII